MILNLPNNTSSQEEAGDEMCVMTLWRVSSWTAAMNDEKLRASTTLLLFNSTFEGGHKRVPEASVSHSTPRQPWLALNLERSHHRKVENEETPDNKHRETCLHHYAHGARDFQRVVQ